MRMNLWPHPDCLPGAVASIHAEAVRPGVGRLELRYLLRGAVDALLLPLPAASTRTDGLWQHSCFEAFVRGPFDESYFEVNFSPSGEWAAYHFKSYRSGMTRAPLPSLAIGTSVSSEMLELSASLAGLDSLPADLPWDLGLSAVIEENSGDKSFWALRHPAGKPDFHHKDCFAHQLNAPEPL